MTRSPRRASIRVVIGPITEPEPTLVAPRSIVPGAIVTSGAISTSASIQVERGSSTVTPARMWRLEDAAARLLGGARQVDAVVDAEVDPGVRRAVGGDAQPGLADQRQHVAQVVLALRRCRC